MTTHFTASVARRTDTNNGQAATASRSRRSGAMAAFP
jgi:hypothetical protein